MHIQFKPLSYILLAIHESDCFIIMNKKSYKCSVMVPSCFDILVSTLFYYFLCNYEAESEFVRNWNCYGNSKKYSSTAINSVLRHLPIKIKIYYYSLSQKCAPC